MPADGMSAAVKIRKKGQSARPTSSSLKTIPFSVRRQCDERSRLRTVWRLESRWQSFPRNTMRCGRRPIRWAQRKLSCSSGPQLVEQRLGLLQVGRIEALGEPVVDRSEKVAGLIPHALMAPQPRQAHRRAQLP